MPKCLKWLHRTCAVFILCTSLIQLKWIWTLSDFTSLKHVSSVHVFCLTIVVGLLHYPFGNKRNKKSAVSHNWHCFVMVAMVTNSPLNVQRQAVGQKTKLSLYCKCDMADMPECMNAEPYWCLFTCAKVSDCGHHLFHSWLPTRSHLREASSKRQMTSGPSWRTVPKSKSSSAILQDAQSPSWSSNPVNLGEFEQMHSLSIEATPKWVEIWVFIHSHVYVRACVCVYVQGRAAVNSTSCRKRWHAEQGNKSSRERRKRRERQPWASIPNPASLWTWMNSNTRVNTTQDRQPASYMKQYCYQRLFPDKWIGGHTFVASYRIIGTFHATEQIN